MNTDDIPEAVPEIFVITPPLPVITPPMMRPGPPPALEVPEKVKSKVSALTSLACSANNVAESEIIMA
jgi:hypothetical protein